MQAHVYTSCSYGRRGLQSEVDSGCELAVERGDALRGYPANQDLQQGEVREVPCVSACTHARNCVQCVLGLFVPLGLVVDVIEFAACPVLARVVLCALGGVGRGAVVATQPRVAASAAIRILVLLAHP